MRIGGVLETLEGVQAAENQLAGAAADIRRVLQVTSALAIGGWLAFSALVWLSGDQALQLRSVVQGKRAWRRDRGAGAGAADGLARATSRGRAERSALEAGGIAAAGAV